MAIHEPEERLDIATASELIHFRGDSIHSENGQHDLRILVAEVEADRLVQEWGYKEPEGRTAEGERYK